MNMRLNDKELLVKIKNDNCLLEFRHLLTAGDRATFADVYKWSPALIGILASDHSFFALLNRLNPNDRKAIGLVCAWSPELIGILASDQSGIFALLKRLDQTDRKAVGSVCAWSPELIGILASDYSIFVLLNKLDQTDRRDLASVCDWSSALIGIMTKNEHAPLSWLNKLSRSELDGGRDVWNWPIYILDRLYVEPQHILPFYYMWDLVNDHAEFIKNYFTINDNQLYDKNHMIDAWSRGQVNSKAWLCATAAVLGIKLGKTWVLCGWLGTLSYFMLVRRQQLGITHIRSFDINPDCCQLADMLNKNFVKDGWKFKATTLDVNSLSYDNFRYQTVKHDGTLINAIGSADTIINTSCDHMGEDKTWWDRIPKGKLVILKNNDWYENDKHNNSVKDIGEFKRQYPMSELLFEGELDCILYTRFMLIGRK